MNRHTYLLLSIFLTLVFFAQCNDRRSMRVEDQLIVRAYSILDRDIVKELDVYVLENDSALSKLSPKRCYVVEFYKTANDSLVTISASVLRPQFYDEKMRFLGSFSEEQRFVLIYSNDSIYSSRFCKLDSLNVDINAYDDSYYLNKMREVDMFPEWRYRFVRGNFSLVEKTRRIKFGE